MDTLTQTGVSRIEGGAVSTASPRDFFDLMKPRVMTLVVFTAFAGLVAAPVDADPLLAFMSILCVAVGAGAAGALNMAYDADIDATMKRTRKRPCRGVRCPCRTPMVSVSLRRFWPCC